MTTQEDRQTEVEPESRSGGAGAASGFHVRQRSLPVSGQCF